MYIKGRVCYSMTGEDMKKRNTNIKDDVKNIKDDVKKKIATAEKIVKEKLTTFYQDGKKRFEKAYKEKVFWKKIKKQLLKIGQSLVEEALTLYYCLKDPQTPREVKITIICALGYLIVPIDLIPDLIVPIGFIDDAAAIALVIKNARENITDSHRKSASAKCQELFKKHK